MLWLNSSCLQTVPHVQSTVGMKIVKLSAHVRSSYVAYAQLNRLLLISLLIYYPLSAISTVNIVYDDIVTFAYSVWHFITLHSYVYSHSQVTGQTSRISEEMLIQIQIAPRLRHDSVFQTVGSSACKVYYHDIITRDVYSNSTLQLMNL